MGEGGQTNFLTWLLGFFLLKFNLEIKFEKNVPATKKIGNKIFVDIIILFNSYFIMCGMAMDQHVNQLTTCVI